MTLLGVIGFVIVSFLPGAWLTFGLRLQGVPIGVRALLAVALSPVAVLGQFYALRWLGVPFDAVATALPFLNLPALYLVGWRWARAAPEPSLADAIPYAAALALPVALLFVYYTQPAWMAIKSHAFLHTDIVYALANGWLKVEESQLAGLTVGYPWGGHVHQAVASRTLGTAPMGGYQWPNLVLFLAAMLLMARVTGELGGGRLARVLTVILVCFGVNAVGYALMQLVPEDLLARYPVAGDESYSPWMWKYTLWNQHAYGQALFAGFLYFAAAPRAVALSRSATALMCLMAIGIAAIFPTFMPAVGTLLGARLLSDVLREPGALRELAAESALPLAIVVVVGGAATLGTLALVGEDRVAGTGFAFSIPWALKIKSAQMAVAFAPLLAGAGTHLFARRAERAERWEVLAIGGLASILLYIVFSLQSGIEYKLVFTGAMCLAPLAALGFDRGLRGWGGAGAGLYALLLLFVVGAGVHRMVWQPHRAPVSFTIRTDDFGAGLPAGHTLDGAARFVAEETTPETIAVVDSLGVHLPAFARRSLYAPPRTEEVFSGLGMGLHYILAINRGYGDSILDARWATTRALFRSGDAAERRAALAEIERLGRPYVVLLDRRLHGEPLATLGALDPDGVLYRDERWIVWGRGSVLVDGEDARAVDGVALERVQRLVGP